MSLINIDRETEKIFRFTPNVKVKLHLAEKKMIQEFERKKYEKASSHQKEWGKRIVEEFKLKGTERILDLGCRDGVLIARLLGYGPSSSS